MPIAAPLTLPPTLPLPPRCRHYRHRHRHRSADRCRYVDDERRCRRAPSPLPLHVFASWKGPPSSLRGKGLTRLLSMILSDTAGLRFGGKEAERRTMMNISQGWCLRMSLLQWRVRRSKRTSPFVSARPSRDNDSGIGSGRRQSNGRSRHRRRQ